MVLGSVIRDSETDQLSSQHLEVSTSTYTIRFMVYAMCVVEVPSLLLWMALRQVPPPPSNPPPAYRHPYPPFQQIFRLSKLRLSPAVFPPRCLSTSPKLRIVFGSQTVSSLRPAILALTISLALLRELLKPLPMILNSMPRTCSWRLSSSMQRTFR